MQALGFLVHLVPELTVGPARCIKKPPGDRGVGQGNELALVGSYPAQFEEFSELSLGREERDGGHGCIG